MTALFRYFLFLPLVLGLLDGCAYNPVTGNREVAFMTEAEERESGRLGDPRVRAQYGVYQGNPGLQAYVSRVGQRVAEAGHRPDLKYSFTILDTSYANAFALPGYVYITRGLLAHLNSEDELAAVLGHEIGHITARHTVQKYSAGIVANLSLAIGTMMVPDITLGNATRAVSAGYGRKLELEADRLAAEYLARAGYDPLAVVSFMRTLKSLSERESERARSEGRAPTAYHALFETHPDHEQRLEKIASAAAQQKPTGSQPPRENFLAHLDGLPFGEGGQDGRLRGSQYFVPARGYAIKFPPNWPIGLHGDQTFAQSPDRQATIQAGSLTRPQASADQVLPRLMEAGQLTQAESVTINGLPGARQSGVKGGRPFKAVLIYLDHHAHLMIASAGNLADLEHHREALDMSLSSVRRMDAQERKLIAQPRLRLYTAVEGDTYEALAAAKGWGKSGEVTLRLLNGAAQTDEPRRGQTVKIVE